MNDKLTKMTTSDFSTTLLLTQAPEEVFNAVNNIRGWWKENVEGRSEKINDEFEVRFGDVHYSKQKLIEVIPGKKVVWLVTESKLSFVSDENEWTNTKIVFEITKLGDKSQLRFTHLGLVQNVECYDACTNAWGGYINNSLRNLITTGKGHPESRETKNAERKSVV